jgi:hypothetical protein
MAELEIKPTAKMRLRVTAVIWIGIGISALQMYLLAGSDLFARRTTLTTYLPDAAGVTTASEVRLSGIRIGGVSKVELSWSLDPRRIVRVQMRVLARYLRSIPSDSETWRRSISFWRRRCHRIRNSADSSMARRNTMQYFRASADSTALCTRF